MPTFEYLCAECNTTYDVFHKVREIKEDVVCPSCRSAKHKRLISSPGVSVGSRKSDSSSCDDAPGGCCGGACGLN